METHTLILTPWMTAHRIVPWQKAAFLYVQGRMPGDPAPVKIDILEEWDEVIRTPRMEFNLPAVVRLTRPVAAYKKGVKFSRINVMTRDDFTCCYCGGRRAMKDLNYDHVVPRRLGGLTVWENIVTSCYDCNSRKAGRTPEQAGMKLRAPRSWSGHTGPYVPKTLPMNRPMIRHDMIPEQWGPYLEAHQHLAVG